MVRTWLETMLSTLHPGHTSTTRVVSSLLCGVCLYVLACACPCSCVCLYLNSDDLPRQEVLQPGDLETLGGVEDKPASSPYPDPSGAVSTKSLWWRLTGGAPVCNAFSMAGRKCSAPFKKTPGAVKRSVRLTLLGARPS